jgi:hypothetical protein
MYMLVTLQRQEQQQQQQQDQPHQANAVSLFVSAAERYAALEYIMLLLLQVLLLLP